MPDGREASCAYCRATSSVAASGGALTLPLIRDSMGNKLIDYTPPQGISGYTQIFRWKSDLDLEIWKALEVPPEIIQAQTSGSGFSGRWIPFAVALSAVHQELAELIRCIDRDILRPIAALNFGRELEYDDSAAVAGGDVREEVRRPHQQPLAAMNKLQTLLRTLRFPAPPGSHCR